jgi:hypothetical protein
VLNLAEVDGGLSPIVEGVGPNSFWINFINHQFILGNIRNRQFDVALVLERCLDCCTVILVVVDIPIFLLETQWYIGTEKMELSHFTLRGVVYLNPSSFNSKSCIFKNWIRFEFNPLN